MTKISCIATFAIAALPALAPAQTAQTIIDRAAAAYGNLTSMRAEFRQTLTNPLTGSTQTTSGVLLRRAPDLLNITFDNGDRVTADGNTLWAYLPSSAPHQVMRMPYNGGNAGSVDPAGQFLNSPRTRYNVALAGTAIITGRKTHALTLEPKRANAPFTHGKVWIDDIDYSIRQFEVENASGLKRQVVITSFTPNPPVDRSAFRFAMPKGAKIVDQTAFSG
jgi:outer membrane lipoprotein carrier protein